MTNREIFAELKQRYKSELERKLFAAKDEASRLELADLFRQMGDAITESFGREGADLRELITSAAAHYLYAMNILTELGSKAEAILRLKEKIISLHSHMVTAIGGTYDTPLDISSGLDDLAIRSHINELRATIKPMIGDLQAFTDRTGESLNDTSGYVTESAALLDKSTAGIKNYYKLLIRDAEAVLGGAPCKYSVIGLGSIALRQITPYSDLEFAILTEREDATISDYFKRLSHYINFKVICLGESTIPASLYDINLDHLARPGVNFDLGGKTPLGRPDKDYELIGTASKFMTYLTDSYEVSAETRRDDKLKMVLENVCYICGNEEEQGGLVREYQEAADKYLLSTASDGKLICEERGIKVLAGENAKDLQEEESMILLLKTNYKKEGNLEEFGFNGFTAEGRNYNVKKELYRLPDRLIYNLGFIYGIRGNENGLSALEVIAQLQEKGVLNEEAAKNLSYAVAYANNIRLRTYDYYGHQKEVIDIQPYDLEGTASSTPVVLKFRLAEEEICEQGALFKYYSIVIPLAKTLNHLCRLCTNDSLLLSPELLKEEYFFANTNSVKAEIHMRLGHYREALIYEEKDLNELENIPPEYHNSSLLHKTKTLEKMSEILTALGDYSKAVQYAEKSLHISLQLYGIDHFGLVGCYSQMSEGYLRLGQYVLALKYTQKALQIYENTFGAQHPVTAPLYNILGCTYWYMQEYKLARDNIKTSLNITQKAFGEEWVSLVSDYNNLAHIYTELGDYRYALKCLQKSLELGSKLLGERHLSSKYEALADIYNKLGEYNKALSAAYNSWSIRIKTLGEEHTDTISSYITLGSAYAAVGDYKQAMETHQRGLKLKQKILGDEHPDVISHRELIQSLERVIESKQKINEMLEKLHTNAPPFLYQMALIGMETLISTKVATLMGSITNYNDIPSPMEDKNCTRIVSYNIAVDFFDGKDTTEDARHHWMIRGFYVQHLLRILLPDIMCLQELSAEQAFEMAKAFEEEFDSVFLSQTPSEITPTGAIAVNEEVSSWAGKTIGAALVGTFIRKHTWKVAPENAGEESTGRFWLNEDPLEAPTNLDRGETDKGFGNMNTYRAVLWVKVINQHTGQVLYIFNSHYPLSGNSNTRKQCAEVEMAMITSIAGNKAWVSAGDRNTIQKARDEGSPDDVYKVLTREGRDVRDHEPDEHYGISNTWLGFSYDEHKAPLEPAEAGAEVLDIMVTNMKPARSFCHPGMFDLDTGELLSLSSLEDKAVRMIAEEGRYFASDHALLGADIYLEYTSHL